MKLASFVAQGRESWGIVEEDSVRDLGARFADLKAALAHGAPGEIADMAADAPRIPLARIAWLPVIPRPDKILCIGINYAMHRAEMGRAEVPYPTVFTRFFNTQVGHGQPIVRPRASRQLDYEGELAVVIGRAGRAIAARDALSHVAGVSAYNDGSVRDWQSHTSQFTPGKNFPSTGAFGPWLVSLDEVGDLSALRLRTRVNGETVQDASTADMIFKVPELIAYCSTFTELVPGDVIITGTPGGVGSKRVPPLWLKDGDLVEVEISNIATLANPVRDEG